MATVTTSLAGDHVYRPFTVVEGYRRAIDERLTEIAKERDTARLVAAVEAVVGLLDTGGTVSLAGLLDTVDERHRPYLLDALAVSVAAGSVEKSNHKAGARYRRT